MIPVLITIHVVACIFLILVVLLQPGNKQSMGAAFGGAGSQTMFGGRGANTFLGKLTAGTAIVFMLTSLTLVFVSSQGGSVTDRFAPTAAPAVDAGAASEPAATGQGATSNEPGAAPAPVDTPTAPAPVEPAKAPAPATPAPAPATPAK